MEDKQMTNQEMMKFMMGFKETIENTMKGIGNEISGKIDVKLNNLDKGLEDLVAEVRNNDSKQEENNKRLEDRLNKLEIDAKRQKFGRMKRNSVNYMDGNREQSCRQAGEREKRMEVQNTNNLDTHGPASQPQKNFQLEEGPVEYSASRISDFQPPSIFQSPHHPDGKEDNSQQEEQRDRMVRTNSWADEVESTYGDGKPSKEAIEDKNQWVNHRRQPSNWADGLTADVRGAADKAGERNKVSRMDRKEGQSSRGLETQHKCRKLISKTVNHWFSESSSEEDVTSDEDSWSTVEREKRSLNKKKKAKERLETKKAEIAMKARRMAGIGPITDQEIENQRKKTRDYELAKIWAVKHHLAVYYRYDQNELNELTILETKRTNRDNIVYIAVQDEQDIRDIYARKVECKCDKTTVKSFIPPQFFERFSTLNMICATRQNEDVFLKTQIRLDERDLVVLTKEKGSSEAYKAVDLIDFVGT